MGVREMREELGRAQGLLGELAGRRPALFRAPYGVRWPGLGRVQRELGLTGVMWTAIGRDWKLGAEAVCARMMARAEGGAILCLHDGRELAVRPDVRTTVDAVRELVPGLRKRGLRMVTVSSMLQLGKTTDDATRE
jgi:peptidoglycan-N-acetylglucosamine deacetylase